MKFTEIYGRAIQYWPDEVLISDGVPTGDSGFNFPTLTKVWDNVEDSVDQDDHWSELAVWSMFQAFHTESRRLLADGKKAIRTRQVSLSDVESYLAENLKVEGWAEHAILYENDLDTC